MERLGAYEILEVLGRGGMGVVYKARHTGLNKLCALELLVEGLDAEGEIGRRFVQEAQVAARLDAHPHFVRVLDAAQLGDPFYMAMELRD